jgi:hypothetical protein
MRIEESGSSGALAPVPIKDYQRLANRNDIFEKIAPYIRDTITLTGNGEPEQVIAVRSLRLGRTLISSDDEEGSRNIAVLSDRLWRRCERRGHPAVVAPPHKAALRNQRQRSVDVSGRGRPAAGDWSSR